MFWRRLRLIGYVALCGGTLLQTATGCDTIIAPIMSSLLASVVSGFIGNLFLAT